LAPVIEHEGAPTLVVIAVDITERATGEIERRKLAQASKTKDELLANMSHELRTHLNAILGLSEALLEEVYGTLTEKQRASLNLIEQGGGPLFAIINDILDLARLESGKVELSLEPVDLRRIGDQAIAFVRDAAEAKRITLTSHFEPDLPMQRGDATRLRQVLVN